jgi:hypothetical protein
MKTQNWRWPGTARTWVQRIRIDSRTTYFIARTNKEHVIWCQGQILELDAGRRNDFWVHSLRFLWRLGHPDLISCGDWVPNRQDWFAPMRGAGCANQKSIEQMKTYHFV